MKLHPVDVKTLTPEIFQVFGTQNALLAAGDRTICNPMTIGWCQLGRLWSRPVCTVYVRPERYTYSLMESHDYFTVSVLPAAKQEIMKLCGAKSGRDMDKVQACGLTVRYGIGDAPFFEESIQNKENDYIYGKNRRSTRQSGAGGTELTGAEAGRKCR